jgi:hypothetical protein
VSREISIAILVGFAIVALLIGFGWSDGSAIARDGSAIAHAKAVVQNNLSDPGSAQFKDIEVIGSGNNITICGNVNAKNKSDGYVGYTPFIYRRGEHS